MPAAQDDREARLQGLMHPDPDHIYSDDELDAIEALDPELALRLDRAQVMARRTAPAGGDPQGPVEPEAVAAAIDEARRILMQDGGDIALIGIEDRTVRVRMQGACAGCPRSALDLRNVVERLVKARCPGVREVANTF